MSEKLSVCEQCDRVYWSKRSTSKFCSPTCRKRFSRGARKVSYYQSARTQKSMDIAELIADKHPQIWRKLEHVRDHYGNRALHEVLDIVELVIRGEN